MITTMSLYTRKSTDALPAVKSPAGLHIGECTKVGLLAWMEAIAPEKVVKLTANDHVKLVPHVNRKTTTTNFLKANKK
jgi:hypothetical protein